MIGLGIETSCDETSIAIVNGTTILSNQIYSQINEHIEFQGVVPEIASRSHLLKINELYEKALTEANISDVSTLNYVAVTTRPGLVGSLMIGAQMARSLNLVHNLPIVTIDHVEAHLYAGFLERGERPSYPFLGLLLSGGNSAIFQVNGPGQLVKLGDTRDDALGEAFDKVSAILNLGYPGGPKVETKANQYTALTKHQSLFGPLLKDLPSNEISFSFSGIKTAVMMAHKRNESIGQIAYDFQNTSFELVERMLKRSLRKCDASIQHIEASGGVLANQTLRNRLNEFSKRKNIRLCYPKSRSLCTDNAAMVAYLGQILFESGVSDPIDFEVRSVR
ncbi:MAG: tRNA (adenosine(37)-N6)-threonylcarbamoyltransferase complex transferase subunit TsaD [Leptonema sp. (in: Bacteria)]|nr:tRNA (adenosine(37)-N6)-threonylcarbamoyltransferase complex transferase subunit TsaD [Leptonema sp. (in: bacteria)]